MRVGLPDTSGATWCAAESGCKGVVCSSAWNAAKVQTRSAVTLSDDGAWRAWVKSKADYSTVVPATFSEAGSLMKKLAVHTANMKDYERHLVIT